MQRLRAAPQESPPLYQIVLRTSFANASVGANEEALKAKGDDIFDDEDWSIRRPSPNRPPMDFGEGASERKLEPELDGARRAEREDARTNANSNNGSVRTGCAVDRARAARENTAQDVSRNVEVREVKQVVE